MATSLIPISRFCGILAEIISGLPQKLGKGKAWDFRLQSENSDIPERGRRGKEHTDPLEGDWRADREESREGSDDSELEGDSEIQDIFLLRDIAKNFISALFEHSISGELPYL